MLTIYREFIVREHRKSLIQGVAFDEKTLLAREFTPEEESAIRAAQAVELAKKGASSVPCQEVPVSRIEETIHSEVEKIRIGESPYPTMVAPTAGAPSVPKQPSDKQMPSQEQLAFTIGSSIDLDVQGASGTTPA